MKKNSSLPLNRLTLLSLYAALIYVSVAALKIPVGPQFIHIGNALVVIALLLFGFNQGFVASALGLAIFDILGGYASTFWIITLETLVVAVLVSYLHERCFKDKLTTKNLFIIALAAAISKIIVNLLRYTIMGMVVSNLPFAAATTAALVKITGTFGTAIVTVVVVPILYPVFKRMLNRVL